MVYKMDAKNNIEREAQHETSADAIPKRIACNVLALLNFVVVVVLCHVVLCDAL